MKMNELLSTILAIPGASMARQNKTNFVVIPTEDGYAKIAVTAALTKDTKTCKAFDAAGAIKAYKEYEAELAVKEAEKAANPKVKGPNPDAQARRDAMDKAIAELPAFEKYTATDITKALEETGFLPKDSLPMQVGQSARRLTEKGVLTVVEENDKRYYTKG